MKKLRNQQQNKIYQIILFPFSIFLEFVEQNKKGYLMKNRSICFKQVYSKFYCDNVAFNKNIKKKRASSNKSMQIDSMKNFNIQTNSKIIRTTTQQSRPKTARPPSSRIVTPLHKQLQSEPVKLFYQYISKIQKQILRQLKKKTVSQIKSVGVQFKILLQFCSNILYQEHIYPILQQFEYGISKHLQHRISKIIFYLLFTKYLECNTNKRQNYLKYQIKMLQLLDQYCRPLNVLSLSLYSCMKLQKILTELKNYEQAKDFAKKALRLSVYIGNRMEQFKAIQAIKMISCCEGTINTNNQNYLSQGDRQLILKLFDPLTDFPEKNKNNNIRNTIFQFEENHLQQTFKVNSNIDHFVSNLALMSKDFNNLSNQVMKTIKKVSKVGSVNKYFSNGNCITLQLRSRNPPSQNRQQVFLTHARKKSSVESMNKFNKFYLPKIIGMLKNLIFYTNNM